MRKMDDKTRRLEILQALKQAYDEDAHDFLDKAYLLGTLGLDENVLDRNVKYLEQKGLIRVDWHHGGGFYAWINAEGIDFLETGQPSGLAILTPLTVHQEFHGSVGAVAGRDINVQISFTEILNKLSESIESDPKIPPEEKQSLMERIKSFGQNEWVRSIGTSVLAEIVKKASGI